MEDKLKKVSELLYKYKQEHLLYFYNEMDLKEKEELLDQLLSIPFEELLKLYEESKSSAFVSTENIEPLPYVDKSKLTDDEITYYSSLGKPIIENNELAVVTLAGGQGSRLGCKGPKGKFELELTPKKSLFEILCDYLKNINYKYNITIPWYIMTSNENYNATIDFFKDKNFFGYPKDNIIFFTQSNLPIIDINGKLVLAEIYKVKEGSNGNGNVFEAMKKHGVIDDMKKRGIKWVFTGGVDNVLLKPADLLFIGLAISSKVSVASKTIFKEEPCNKDWIFAKKDGKPAIVDCENFVEEVSAIKDSKGNFLYRECNILAHLFTIDAIEKLSLINFPYHRAFRKSAFVNEEGMKQVPEAPNIYKFEQFIFDAFPHFDEIALLRVKKEEEFAPIKDFNGPNNPEIAKILYEKYVLNEQ